MFECVVIALSSLARRSREAKNLLILLLISSFYGMLNYVAIVTEILPKNNTIPLVVNIAMTASSFIYAEVICQYLKLKSRTIEFAKYAFLVIGSLSFLCLILELGIGTNPLYDNELIQTKNIFLNFVKARGNPSALMKLLGTVYILSIFVMAAKILGVLLRKKEKDWILIAGQVMTVVSCSQDIFLMAPEFAYIFPMGFMSFIIETIRFSYHYQKMSQIEISKLQNDNVQLTRVAEVGYGIGQICHDLRNPIHSINLSSSLALKKLGNKEGNTDNLVKQLQIISRSSALMTNIFDTYLAKIKNQSLEEKEYVRVTELIEIALEITKAKKDKYKGLEIKLLFEDNEIHSKLRRNDIVMSFVNLIDNSIDAIKDLEERWIKIIFQKIGSELEINFIDSGPGITKDVADRIFEASYSTKGAGSGLGLSFVKSVLNQHDGFIYLDQRAPNTSFVLRLPS